MTDKTAVMKPNIGPEDFGVPPEWAAQARLYAEFCAARRFLSTGCEATNPPAGHSWEAHRSEQMDSKSPSPALRQVIAGAIYDFAARLTCRQEPITLGSAHNAAPAAEACDEFLRLRGCSEGEPCVRDWQNYLDGNAAHPMASLTQKLREDDGYAWSWHCAMACCAADEGLNHAASNRAAARFMKVAFDIDTTKHPGYPK